MRTDARLPLRFQPRDVDVRGGRRLFLRFELYCHRMLFHSCCCDCRCWIGGRGEVTGCASARPGSEERRRGWSE